MIRFARTLAVVAFACGTAHAQTEAARDAAAEMLGREGLRLFEEHDCIGAVAKLDQAEAIAPNALYGLRAAQCLEKLGRLVEAEERSLRASKLDTTGEAQRFHDSIVPRLGHLHLDIVGKPDAIEVDGRNLTIVTIVTIAVDPGVHRVVVRGEGREARGEATTGEGEDRTLSFVLEQPKKPVLALDDRKPASTPKKSPLRLVGIGGMIAGGVLVGVGIATFGMALSESSTLDTLCPNRVCVRSSDIDARLSRYDTLKTVSLITVIAGAVLGAAGLTAFVF